MQPVLSAWTVLLLLIVGILALAGPVTEELHLCVHACAYACRLAGKGNLGLQIGDRICRGVYLDMPLQHKLTDTAISTSDVIISISMSDNSSTHSTLTLRLFATCMHLNGKYSFFHFPSVVLPAYFPLINHSLVLKLADIAPSACKLLPSPSSTSAQF